MSISYAVLKAEVINDPLGLGYAPYIAPGNDQAIVNILNTVRPSSSITRTLVDAWEVVNSIVPVEYAALTAPAREYLNMVISANKVQLGGGAVRDGLSLVFGVGTTTRANITALLSRPGTRAEELFGIDIKISLEDIALARKA